MSLNENFYALFARHVATDVTASCLVTSVEEHLNRGWLEVASAQYANALVSFGLRVGDRVAVQAEKSPEMLALYLGCLRSGACFVPLNTAYSNEEMRYLLEDCKPRIVVSQANSVRELVPDALGFDLKPDGTGSIRDARVSFSEQFDTVSLGGEAMAAILYTSGTTGRPKGSVMSHRSLRSAALDLGQEWGFSGRDVLLHALPLFHGHGLFISCNVALAAGATIIFLDRFDPDLIIANLPRATVFMGVPTYYHRLLAKPQFTAEVCRNLRLMICGSAPLSVATLSEVERRTGHRIIERYGATEAMIICSNPVHGERRAGSVGLPLKSVELRIADPDDNALPDGGIGMIQIRSAALFNGYWGRPEATLAEFTADGFFRTGDLGTRSADGYITVTGRSKDLIISGGYNVYPAEVEEALRELESVSDAAVVGRPDDDFGEVAVAFLVPAPGRTLPASGEVRAWAKGRMANYKVPKDFIVIEELPRNTMGKVLKTELRAMLTPPDATPNPYEPAKRGQSVSKANNQQGEVEMASELFKKGLKIRKEVLGAEYVEAALRSADDFTVELQELITAYSWGEIWSRPGLDRKTRSLLNIAIATTANRSGELKLHVRGAINNGVSKGEIKEVLLQCAVYCGAPAAVDGFRLAKEAFSELNV
ncbi:AMP-binding protein [Sinorhizobium sp. GL28]|uniref:AMP-binding protein n=1 Tax=Sinorhizobium sp. GL28 TaxID=1358418 RepID=UPI0007240B01|nr:AMP-binding protein [Sinorhizobium sp. GL28]KSV84157.1 hypothetical protein N184_12755 [Sinorhizobium sp. GL28]